MSGPRSTNSLPPAATRAREIAAATARRAQELQEQRDEDAARLLAYIGDDLFAARGARMEPQYPDNEESTRMCARFQVPSQQLAQAPSPALSQIEGDTLSIGWASHYDHYQRDWHITGPHHFSQALPDYRSGDRWPGEQEHRAREILNAVLDYQQVAAA